MKKKKLKKMLRQIHWICGDHQNCQEGCPLYLESKQRCSIMSEGTPAKWTKDHIEYIARALKTDY